MANGARGEVELAIGEARLTLCLTLGALAEIETAFGGDMAGRMQRLSAADLVTILRALLKGGGEAQAAAEDACRKVHPHEAARAIAACFAAAGSAA